jgi:prepilin-type N-terminal cleavage/methylation domain-containing protein
MMKAGFTLIELMVSLIIASILSVSLTLFLSQTSAYQASVEDRASVHTRASIALHQMEKDITGARVPIENVIAEQEKNAAKKKQAPATPEKNPQEKNQKPEAAPGGAKKEEPVKPVARVFYAEQKEDNLILFTCVTSNPLKVYWSKSVGAPKPAIARVVYRLKPDPEHPDSFILMWQEGADLDVAAYDQKAAKSVRSYEVIDGIKSCSMRFMLVELDDEKKKAEEADPASAKSYGGQGGIAEKEEKPEKKKNEKKEGVVKEGPPKVTEHKTWDWPLPENTKQESTKKSSAAKAGKGGDEEPSAPLPTFVVLTLALWDARYERATEFVYTIPIYASVALDAKDAQKGESKAVSEEKPGAPKPEGAPSAKSLSPAKSVELLSPRSSPLAASFNGLEKRGKTAPLKTAQAPQWSLLPIFESQTPKPTARYKV